MIEKPSSSKVQILPKKAGSQSQSLLALSDNVAQSQTKTIRGEKSIDFQFKCEDMPPSEPGQSNSILKSPIPITHNKSYVCAGSTPSKYLNPSYDLHNHNYPRICSEDCLIPVRGYNNDLVEAYLILLEHPEPVRIAADGNTIGTYMISRQYLYESFRENDILTYYFTQLSKHAYKLRMCDVNENREKLKSARQWVAMKRAQSVSLKSESDSGLSISKHHQSALVHPVKSNPGSQSRSVHNKPSTRTEMSQSGVDTGPRIGVEPLNTGKSDFAQAVDFDLSISENQTLTLISDPSWTEETKLFNTVIKSIQRDVTNSGELYNRLPYTNQTQLEAGDPSTKSMSAAGGEANQEKNTFDWYEFFGLLDGFFKSRDEIVTEIRELHEKKLNTDTSCGVLAEDLFDCLADIQQEWEENNSLMSELELDRMRKEHVESKLNKPQTETEKSEKENPTSHRETKVSEPLHEKPVKEEEEREPDAVPECKGTCAKLFGVCTCYPLNHRSLNQILQSLLCRVLKISSYSSSVFNQYQQKSEPIDTPVPPADFATLWNFLASENFHAVNPLKEALEPYEIDDKNSGVSAPGCQCNHKQAFTQLPVTCCTPFPCVDSRVCRELQTTVTDCGRRNLNTKCAAHTAAANLKNDKNSIWDLSSEQVRGIVGCMDDEGRMKLFNMLKLRKIMAETNSSEPTPKPSQVSVVEKDLTT